MLESKHEDYQNPHPIFGGIRSQPVSLTGWDPIQSYIESRHYHYIFHLSLYVFLSVCLSLSLTYYLSHMNESTHYDTRRMIYHSLSQMFDRKLLQLNVSRSTYECR